MRWLGVINLTWEKLQIAKHKSVRWAERTPSWFVLCDLQMFSGEVYHPKPPHAQSLFLFPIVFGINIYRNSGCSADSFCDVCVVVVSAGGGEASRHWQRQQTSPGEDVHHYAYTGTHRWSQWLWAQEVRGVKVSHWWMRLHAKYLLWHDH